MSEEEIAVEQLTEAQARGELARLARVLAEADAAYHAEDAPLMSDAAYDALKARNAAIEARGSNSNWKDGRALLAEDD